MTPQDKLKKLRQILADSGGAAIALSGGTDSTFLVSVASGIKELRVLAVTVSTPYMFASEVEEAAAFCASHGVTHREIRMEIPETVTGNPPDRCYLCKTEVMGAIRTAALEAGISLVFDGTNADDVNDYRPGMRALAEQNVRSPLLEAGLTKNEIRMLAREAGLEVSDKPSNACLLTRFPHDTAILTGELRKAEEAEAFLAVMGLGGSRVRVHGDLVRIECRKDLFPLIMEHDTRLKIITAFKNMGFKYITVDIEGYRSGSMN
jgi:pyridinium-3,5-biscarboxylic acid mononucleotide sulfurtransferase